LSRRFTQSELAALILLWLELRLANRRGERIVQSMFSCLGLFSLY
jgi:hypothetical protein